MAQNDALSFYVKFYEDAQHNIQGLVKKMQGELKNLTFNLKAENVNISGLEQALKKIQPIDILNKDSIKKAEESISTIHRLLQKAFPEGGDQISKPFLSLYRVLGELRNGLSGLNSSMRSNDLARFTSQINSIATAMTNLNEKLEVFNTKFANKLGQGIGRGLEKQRETYRKMAAENEALNKQISDKMNQSDMARSYDKARSVIAEVNNLLVGVRQNLEAASRIGFNTGNLETYEKQLLAVQELAQKVISGHGAYQYKSESPVGMGAILQGEHFDELKKNITGEKKAVEEIQKSLDQLDSLEKRLGKISSSSSSFASAQQMIGKIAELRSKLTNPDVSMRDKHTFINQYLDQVKKDGEKLVQEYEKIAREEARERKRLEEQQKRGVTTNTALSESHQRTAHTSEQVAASQHRMEQAISQATGKAQHQSSVLGDLRSMAAQYVSAWGAWNFAKEVANITGELELQQKSLEVIIGSAGQAQDLFNNIKGLSQMSPYTFQDMLKSTRQLAAFGVKTKDLYGTMKSLSDLGAGLNVDVQRLILAYGHVKSAGVLSGIQRRQFETAGINITGEIAKLWNARYERAGSDERVTNADIFKKITKREIGFSDVEEAIERMTSKGGKFYNMQLQQYDTLGGKLRNLRNNYNIMLDDIGKSYMGLLTGTVDAMNSMMENWRTWGALIKSVTVALVAAKVASLAFGKSMAGHRAASLTLLRDRINAQHLAALQGNYGSIRQNSMMFNRDTSLGMSYARGINNSDMSRFQKIKSALYSNVAYDARKSILDQQGMGKAYQDNITKLTAMANSTKTMTRLQGQWGLAFQRLKVSANAFFATMRAGFVAIATNPMVWIGAAIAGITALTNKASELKEMRESAIKRANNIAEEDTQGIFDVVSPMRNRLIDRQALANGEGYKIDEAALNKFGVEKAFEELDEAMQKFDPLYKGHIFDIKMLADDKAKVLEMMDDLDAAAEGKRAFKDSAAGIFQANSDSGYGEDARWYNLGLNGHWGQWDTAIDEAKEYEKELLRIRGIAQAYEEDIYNVMLAHQKGGYGDEIEKSADAITEIMRKNNSSDFGKALNDYISQGGQVKISTDNFTFDTSDLKEKLDSFREKSSGMIIAMYSKLKEMTDAKLGAKYKASYIKEAIDGILGVDGKEITDPEAVESIKQAILDGFTPPEGASEKVKEEWAAVMDDTLAYLQQNVASAEMNTLISDMLRKGEINNTMSKDEIVNIVRPAWEAIRAEHISQAKNARLRDITQGAFSDAFSNFSINPTPAIQKLDQLWKKIYTEAKDMETQDFYLKFGVIIDAATDSTSMWESIDKAMDENRKKIEKLSKRYTVFHKINFSMDAAFDVKTLESQLKKIIDQMSHTQMGSSSWFALDKTKNSLIEMISAYKQAGKEGVQLESEAREKAQKAASKESEKNRKAAEKASKAAEKAKRDQEKAARDAEQKEIERIQLRIDLLRDLRREYKELRKDYSKDAALRVVRERYKHDYGNNGPLRDSELDSLDNYSAILEEEIKKIGANGKIKEKEKRDKLIERARKEQSNLESTMFREASDEMLSQFNSDLQKLIKQYEIARKVIDATGDTDSASRLSGLGSIDITAGFIDNILERTLNSRFTALLQSQGMDAAKAIDIDLDFAKVRGLDDKGIEEYVKNLIGDEDNAELVQAISSWLKEYKKQYESVENSAVDAYTKAMAAGMDYESQLQRINSDLKTQNDLIDRNSSLTPEQRATGKARNNAAADLKRIEITDAYKRFFNGIFTETREEMEIMSRVLRGKLMQNLKTGKITAEEYANKIKEIDKVMNEFDQQDSSRWFDNYFGGKTKDKQFEDQYNRGGEIYQKGADLIQRGTKANNDAMIRQGEAMQKEGAAMMDGANKGRAAIAIVDKVVKAVDNAIQGTVKAFNYLKESLDALGVESDTMSAIGDYLGTLGNMSGHVKGSWDAFKNNDYIGASVEAFGAVTSLITGIAQAHDNRLERKIERIKQDTEKMSNTLESIRSLRERTLGYDSGIMRRVFASAYNNQSGDAQSAMSEYYTRYSGGSGYQQELALLIEQRDKILEMYDLENDKKKKNKEALEEYKTQIAALDEQIAFFTEDLAKELWGIDMKGWSEQISDALMTAFENGTSAASAFKDVVQDIMRGVVKSMLNVGIIEPAFEKLREKLFGKDGKGGIFNPDDPKSTMGATLTALGDWFKNDGARLMDTANEFFNGADDLLKQTMGYGLKDSDRSSSATTNSLQSTASEETMGIVAGYLSRLSQDVSVMRIMQEMYVNGSFPDYIERVTNANNSLSNIDRSTVAMMEMMRDGNGALYDRVENMSRRLDNFANGIDRITMR